MQLQLIETSELEARLGAITCAMNVMRHTPHVMEQYEDEYKTLTLMALEVRTLIYRERRTAPITGNESLRP